MVQSLHGAIYHLAFRKWVHGESLSENWAKLIGEKIDLFLKGAERRFREALAMDVENASDLDPGRELAGGSRGRLANYRGVLSSQIGERLREYRDGAVDAEQAEQMIRECHNRIAALEQLVGRQALQLELLKSERNYDDTTSPAVTPRSAA